MFIAMPTLFERLMSRVTKTPTCWIWNGATLPKGYGTMHGRRQTLLTHRVAYELAFGPIPDGRMVLHRCDTPACVRPSHLFLGTAADNTLDMVLKNRHQRSCKLTADDVRRIRELSHQGLLQREIAARFGIAQTTVSYALRHWKHITTAFVP